MDRWDSDSDVDLSCFESRVKSVISNARNVQQQARASGSARWSPIQASSAADMTLSAQTAGLSRPQHQTTICVRANSSNLSPNAQTSVRLVSASTDFAVSGPVMVDSAATDRRHVSESPLNARSRHSLSPALSTGTSATDSESAITEDELLLDGLELPIGLKTGELLHTGADSDAAAPISLQALLKRKLEQRLQLQQPSRQKPQPTLVIQPADDRLASLFDKFRDEPESHGPANGLVMPSEIRLRDRLTNNRRFKLSAPSSSIPVLKSRRRSSLSESTSTILSTSTLTSKPKDSSVAAVSATPLRQSDRPKSAMAIGRSRLPRRSSSSLSLSSMDQTAQPQSKPAVSVKTPPNPLRLSQLGRILSVRAKAAELQSPMTPSLARPRIGDIARAASALGTASRPTRASLSRRASSQDLSIQTAVVDVKSGTRPRSSLSTKPVASSVPSTPVRQDGPRAPGGFAAPTMASLSKSRAIKRGAEPGKSASGHVKSVSDQTATNTSASATSRRVTSSSDGAVSTAQTKTATTRPTHRPRVASVTLSAPSTPRNYGDGTELDHLDDLPAGKKPSLYSRPRFKQQTKARRVVAQTALPASSDLLKPDTATRSKNRVRPQPKLIKNLAQLAGQTHEVMRWNVVTQKWDGNDSVAHEFDKAISSPSTSSLIRPALISDLSVMSPRRVPLQQLTSTKAIADRPIKVVGSMMFDAQALRWVSVLGPEDEDELDLSEDDSVFADDEAEHCLQGSSTASAAAVAGTGTLKVKQNAWERGELSRKLKSRASFAMSDDVRDQEGWTRRQKLVRACEEAEARSRSELEKWMTVESAREEQETRERLWDLRRLVLDTGSPFR
ncbi:hypothetical protein ACM66B_000568 [Microbotryomycetes sp. NB124-2]